MAGRQGDWRRYAAPTAFLAVATIAIVLVASALHHASDRTTTTTTTASTPPPAQTRPVTTKTTTGPSGRRFYTVVAGDTFGVIATKTGTSVADIERLNPGISSTSLHIGQKLRIA